LRICLKELRESFRWLRLAKRVSFCVPASEMDGLLRETDELIRIFVKSIQTAENRRKPAASQPGEC